MAKVSYFKVDNDPGEKLFYLVRKMCVRKGITFLIPKSRIDRRDVIMAQRKADLVILDCSVESGHIYRLVSEWIKVSKKYVILSRTSLPQNVATYYQFAAIHGHSVQNEYLIDWLEYNIELILKGLPPSAFLEHREKFEYDFGMFRWSYKYFLSFRGSHETNAHDFAIALRQRENASVRMIPEGQYAYESECMTLQQMWGVVAQLTRDMSPTKKIILILSDDYLDSFWTTSELLTCLKHGGRKNSFINRTYALENNGSLTKVTTNREGYNIPHLSLKQSLRMFQLLQNSDPYSIAPETQISPRGTSKLIAMLLGPMFGYYNKEFTSSYWYHTVWVPCLKCRQRNRQRYELNWKKHLSFWLDQSKHVIADFDYYFGYFSLSRDKFEENSEHQCPNCKTTIKLVNRRQPRTLWMPIQKSEVDKDREVIIERPVYEVLNEHELIKKA